MSWVRMTIYLNVPAPTVNWWLHIHQRDPAPLSSGGNGEIPTTAHLRFPEGGLTGLNQGAQEASFDGETHR